MKLKFALIVLLLLTACGAPTTTPSSLSDASPITPSVEDTPAPAEIDAPIIYDAALVSIHFLNEHDGWGVTETQIVRTNDGGVTWYNVTPTNVTETGYGVDLVVLDNNNAWVQLPDFENYPNSGTLYRTTNGGVTWWSATAPFSQADIHFLDANNGWALADLGVGAGSNAVAVYQTSDGGSTWDQTYINDPNNPNARDSLPLGGLKSGLTPLNMKTAWVSGIVYAEGVVYLYRTDDGGANWSQVTTLSLPPAAQTTQVSFDPVQFVSAQDAFVTMRIPSDQTQMAVYVSNDAGNTWSLTPTLIPNGGSADFLSATDVVIYNREQFYVTRDAARTWSIIPPDINFGEMFAVMDFINLNTGWVITLDPTTNHRSLYRTSDGGLTWSPIIP